MNHLSQAIQAEPQAFQSLTTLDLNYNEIGDEGMNHLSQAIQAQPQAFQSLTTLDLIDNEIGDEGRRHLSQARKIIFTK